MEVNGTHQIFIKISSFVSDVQHRFGIFKIFKIFKKLLLGNGENDCLGSSSVNI